MSPSSVLLIGGMACLAGQGAVFNGTSRQVLCLWADFLPVHNCVPDSVITEI